MLKSSNILLKDIFYMSEFRPFYLVNGAYAFLYTFDYSIFLLENVYLYCPLPSYDQSLYNRCYYTIWMNKHSLPQLWTTKFFSFSTKINNISQYPEFHGLDNLYEQ